MQVFGLGDKAELLVAVQQPEGAEGATTVVLTSDLATPAVLHWGVRRGKRNEWLRPPSEVREPEYWSASVHAWRQGPALVGAPWEAQPVAAPAFGGVQLRE